MKSKEEKKKGTKRRRRRRRRRREREEEKGMEITEEEAQGREQRVIVKRLSPRPLQRGGYIER